jgi:hypothetical protein
MLASLVVAAVAAIGACTQPAETKPGTTVPASSPAAVPSQSPAASPNSSPGDKKDLTKIHAVVGDWSGQEGASLKVVKNGEKYEIEIKTKDGSKKFEGTYKAPDSIEFVRNGKTETIKAATLEETGMKWAGGEKTCVVIIKGSEAFCKK